MSDELFEINIRSDMELYRWNTWRTKEPEMLRWIDMFHAGKNFFDVGANIGIYSMYASAVDPTCNVYAFEPHIFNYGALFSNKDL